MKRLLKYLFITFAILLFTISNVFPIRGEGWQWKKEWHDDYYTNRLTKNTDCIIIAASKGVVKLNKTDNTFYNASNEYLIDEECRITAILAQGNDTLYYSDGYYGPRLFDGNTTKNYYSPINERGDNYSYSLALDSSNDIWINFTGHFSKPTEFNIFPINQPYIIHDAIYGAPTAVIMDMAFDSKGNLWMATYGLFFQAVYFQSQQESSTTTDVISGGEKEATSIVVDFDDNIWLTSDDGIHYYNQETGRDSILTNATNPTIPATQFYANDIDNEGNIWFSSSTILMKYNGAEFTTYTCDGYEEARAILCDEDIVWVLLKSDKLLKFQNNEFETIDLSPAVTGIEESSIEETSTKAYVSNGVLYIENAEGINSVEIYDTAGKIITSGTYNNASAQVSLPTTIKGVIMVKVNNEVVKVMI
ncbi:MAG: hypothetical protein IKL50_06295 [Bacteroidales bacterium]|nr:hypothetical protein [Bacteroidales bacterium]